MGTKPIHTPRTQVTGMSIRVVGPYRARIASRRVTVSARWANHSKGRRTVRNRKRVSQTCSGLGTTTVQTADRTIPTTIQAPTPKATTRAAMLSTIGAGAYAPAPGQDREVTNFTVSLATPFAT